MTAGHSMCSCLDRRLAMLWWLRPNVYFPNNHLQKQFWSYPLAPPSWKPDSLEKNYMFSKNILSCLGAESRSAKLRLSECMQLICPLPVHYKVQATVLILIIFPLIVMEGTELNIQHMKWHCTAKSQLVVCFKEFEEQYGQLRNSINHWQKEKEIILLNFLSKLDWIHKT